MQAAEAVGDNRDPVTRVIGSDHNETTIDIRQGGFPLRVIHIQARRQSAQPCSTVLSPVEKSSHHRHPVPLAIGFENYLGASMLRWKQHQFSGGPEASLHVRLQAA